MSKIEFNDYAKLNFSIKEKIPVNTVVYTKKIENRTLGKNYVEPSEYWNNKKIPHSLYNLVKKESLETIYNDYDVPWLDLIMVKFETSKRKMDNELKDFITSNLNQTFNQKELENFHDTWLNNNEKLLEYGDLVFKRTTQLQKWVNTEKKKMNFVTSPINIISALMECDFKIRQQNNGKVFLQYSKPENGFDIYLASFCSAEVPFICYKGTDNVYVKAYDKELGIPLETIKPNDTEIEEPHTLTLVVFNERVGLSKLSLESYSTVKIYLKTNTITFNSRIMEKNLSLNGEPIVIERIRDHLPIEVENLRENNIFGEFTIYGLNLNTSLFLDMIMMDKTAREIIYMDESSSPLSIKKRISFHLKEPNLVIGEKKEHWNKFFSFLFHQEISNKAEKKEILDYSNPNNQVRNLNLPNNMPYIKVLVNKSENRETLELGLLFITNLIAIYKEREMNLEKLYQGFGVKFSKDFTKEWNLSIDKEKKLNIEGDDYIRDLENAVPHIFVKGYGTKICQNSVQPVILPPSIVEKWNREHENKYEKAVRFPFSLKGKVGEQQFNLACGVKDPSKPFVAMKENKLSNQDEYPFLPCCTSKNTQEPGSNSFFTAYYLGENVAEKKISATSEITTRKILLRGQTGELNPIIESTLRIVGLSKMKERVRRFGVSFSKYSAVQCLLYAIQDKNYMKYFREKQTEKNEDKMEKTIEEMLEKSFSSGKIHPQVLSQELFDVEFEDIVEKVMDMQFFDTFEFYRWLEEYFNLHVFTFSISKDDNVVLEIPRHKFFHARPFENKKCVILLKHWGSDPNSIDYPMYELVVKGDSTVIFSEEISKNLMNMTRKIHTVYQVEVSGTPTIRKNPYSIQNLGNMFKNASSQYIDNAGKMRGVTIPLTEEHKVSIYFPPSQPLNLPVEDAEYAINLDLALSFFDDEPTAYSSSGGLVDGLWFPIYDIEQGIYIPLIQMSREDFEEEMNLPEGRPNPFYAFGDNILEEHHNMDKMRHVYLSCLLWAYLTYSRNTYSSVMVDHFVKKYITVKHFDYKTALIDINTTLPKVESINDAMEHLNKNFPFVSGKKFLCVNEDMYEKIKYFLEITVKNFKKEHKIVVREKIKNPNFQRPDADINTLTSLYSVPDDFNTINGMQVFLSLPEFKNWLYNKILNKGDKILIVERMDISYSAVKNPFIYKQEGTNQTFIVQNVFLGNEKRAIQNQITFREDNTNIGYQTPETTESIKDITRELYIIAPSGNLVFNSRIEGSQYKNSPILLIDYGENIYASLIKII